MLVALAVIILPEIFKGDGNQLAEKNVPAEPDYRFPPPKEAPRAPPMATAPIVPVDDSAKEAAARENAEQAKKAMPESSDVSDKNETGKKSPVVAENARVAEKEPVVSKPGQVNAFVVQVGSFSSETNAIALRDKLRKLGFATFVEAVKGKQGMIYRVRVGPELTHNLAEKLKENVAKKAKLNGVVQSYP